MRLKNEKVWLNVPLIKRKFTILYVIYFIVLISITAYDLITKNIRIGFYYNVLFLVLIMFDIFNSRFRVITSDENIEVILPLMRKKICLNEVSSYNIKNSNIVIYTDKEILDINTKYLEDKEEFTKFIEEKLYVRIDTKCLVCGKTIAEDQKKCASCNWSWRE